MADITHGTWIKDGKAVDAVYQDGVKVYGRNLLLSSQTQAKDGAWYSQNIDWTTEQGTYLGSNIEYITTDWSNARYSYKDLLDRGVINYTDDFTYSVYFRVVGEDPAEMSYAYINFISSATTKDFNVPVQITSLKENQWTRIVVTFKFKDVEHDQTDDYVHSIRVEVSNAPKVAGAHYEFAAPKLELGAIATPYSIAPEDILN